MRELRMLGSVRGALSNGRLYRDRGGISRAEIAVAKQTVFRALNERDALNLNAGQSLVGKAPEGRWNAIQHVLNKGPGRGGAGRNSPWISTTREPLVAEAFRHGINQQQNGYGVVSIYLGKVPVERQVELWKILPRKNTVTGLESQWSKAYHRSIWTQEVTIRGPVPYQAVGGPPLTHVPMGPIVLKNIGGWSVPILMRNKNQPTPEDAPQNRADSVR